MARATRHSQRADKEVRGPNDTLTTVFDSQTTEAPAQEKSKQGRKKDAVHIVIPNEIDLSSSAPDTGVLPVVINEDTSDNPFLASDSDLEEPIAPAEPVTPGRSAQILDCLRLVATPALTVPCTVHTVRNQVMSAEKHTKHTHFTKDVNTFIEKEKNGSKICKLCKALKQLNINDDFKVTVFSKNTATGSI
ncbi:hypothetical protein BDQ17DRAFT_1422314 [Cyathus striatus]|nr:hypothetical protein BDQ17DRAFT_1422314 [Cyathus striatus]